LNSWVNEINHSDDHNSDSEFDPSEHSDDDVSMTDDSDDVLIDQENSLDNDVPNFILQNDGVSDDDDSEDEEEEDDVVAAFISASSERNRNHPPNLSVDGSLIGGFSFHPNTNVIAIGLSTGDIAMYICF